MNRRIVILFFMCLWIIFGMAISASAMETEEQRARSVKIGVRNVKFGTGFFLDGNTIITAKHVVDSLRIGHDVDVKMLNMDLVGKLKYLSPDQDIALITLDVMLPFKPVKLLEKSGGIYFARAYGFPSRVEMLIDHPRIPDKVVLMDFRPETAHRPVYNGLIVFDEYIKSRHGVSRMVYMPFIGPGFSGGGIISDEGVFLGVLSWRLPGEPGKGGIIPAEKFYKVVNNIMRGDDVTTVLD